MSLIKRLFQPPKRSYFLFGPRGTGKTTLIKRIYHDALRIDLLKPDIARSYLAKPERLYDLVAGNPQQSTIVIDEVQKAPELLSVVHDLIEEQPDLQFILTGSSSRKLKRVGTNLLAGRALKCNLYPFVAAELDEMFNLDHVIQLGSLPLVQNADAPSDVLQTYIDLYMREEVYLEGVVRNVEAFSRFLEVICFSHAQLLNVSNIANDCQVKRKAVENYLSILEDLLLGFRLPVFTHQAKREMVAHPKFYLFDSGVYQVLRPKHFGDGPATHDGPALEGIVAMHLKAWNDYSKERNTLAFWRTRAGVEVDFIVYGEKVFYAIEVKHSEYIVAKDLKPLEIFLSLYPEATAILLYRGKTQVRMGNVWCLPCEQWLKSLVPDDSLGVLFE